MSLFKFLRIAILVTILIVVAASQYLKESALADWEDPVWVSLFPIAADGRASTQNYIKNLQVSDFDDISAFVQKQGRNYGQALNRPIIIQLEEPLEDSPPPLPRSNSGLTVALWSLKMRWWAWRKSSQSDLPEAHVQIFVQYRDEDGESVMDRSVGLRKGMYAIVNAYASTGAASRNRVVMTHELMHVLGASDKYDLANSMPIHPEGYANPNASPLFPQRRAEIMGGRIPVSAGQARMPASLAQCVLGSETAREIGW